MYLGEAKFYEERMDEFIMVDKNLEVKELSKGVEHFESQSCDTIQEATQLIIEKIEIKGNLNKNNTNSTLMVDEAEILWGRPTLATQNKYTLRCQTSL